MIISMLEAYSSTRSSGMHNVKQAHRQMWWELSQFQNSQNCKLPGIQVMCCWSVAWEPRKYTLVFAWLHIDSMVTRRWTSLIFMQRTSIKSLIYKTRASYPIQNCCPLDVRLQNYISFCWGADEERFLQVSSFRITFRISHSCFWTDNIIL